MITEKQREIASEAVAAVVKTAIEHHYGPEELGKVAEATAQALIQGFKSINQGGD